MILAEGVDVVRLARGSDAPAVVLPERERPAVDLGYSAPLSDYEERAAKIVERLRTQSAPQPQPAPKVAPPVLDPLKAEEVPLPLPAFGEPEAEPLPPMVLAEPVYQRKPVRMSDLANCDACGSPWCRWRQGPALEPRNAA